MKKLLFMLVVAICAMAWRSEDLMHWIGLRDQVIAVAIPAVESINVQRPMSAQEFAELSKTDPAAYHRFINSYRVEDEPSAVDKLMNFFARGKYE